MFCWKCGNEINEGDKFSPNVGRSNLRFVRNVRNVFLYLTDFVFTVEKN